MSCESKRDVCLHPRRWKQMMREAERSGWPNPDLPIGTSNQGQHQLNPEVVKRLTGF